MGTFGIGLGDEERDYWWGHESILVLNRSRYMVIVFMDSQLQGLKHLFVELRSSVLAMGLGSALDPTQKGKAWCDMVRMSGLVGVNHCMKSVVEREDDHEKPQAWSEVPHMHLNTAMTFASEACCACLPSCNKL
jgi:hypothetical protein